MRNEQQYKVKSEMFSVSQTKAQSDCESTLNTDDTLTNNQDDDDNLQTTDELMVNLRHTSNTPGVNDVSKICSKNGKEDVKCDKESDEEGTENKSLKFRCTSDLKVAIKGSSLDSCVIEWEDKTGIVSPKYTLSVWGKRFASKSDNNQSFDYMTTLMPDSWPTEKDTLTQKVWSTDQNIVEIHGLKTKKNYSFAVFVYSRGDPQICLRSDVAMVTMPGRPKAPLIKVLSLNDKEFTITWRKPCSYGEAKIIGYRLFKNGVQQEDLLPGDAVQHTIHHLLHDTLTQVSLIAVTGHLVGDSAESNLLKMYCPSPPSTPEIVQCLSTSPNTISISWSPVVMTASVNQIKLLFSYDVFVDDVLHGSCASRDISDVFQETFTYTIPQCIAGRTYSIYIRSHVDPVTMDSKPQTYVCGCYGEMSNILKVTCDKQTIISGLAVSRLDEDVVELTWNTLPENVFHLVKGYVLRVNGRIHGNILDPDSTSVKIANLTFGDDISLSLAPILNQERASQLRVNPRHNDGLDSGVESSSSMSVDRLIASRDVGPSSELILHFWGLVFKVNDIIIDEITCCSADIRWNVLERPITHGERPLYVNPEGFNVLVLEGENELERHKTKDLFVNVKGLKHDCTYTVVIESYAGHPNDASDEFTLNTSISKKYIFTTKPLPCQINNVQVDACTFSSISLSWDPLKLDSSVFIHLGVSLVDSSDFIFKYIISSQTTSYTIKGLDPKTHYKISLFTSYESTTPPNSACQSSISSTTASTSGIDRPYDVHVTKRKPFSINISWQPAIAYGELSVSNYRVHYYEKKSRTLNRILSESKTLEIQPDSAPLCAIPNLEPGVTYVIAVEAVVVSSCKNQENNSEDSDEVESSVSSSGTDWISSIGNDCLSKAITISTTAPPGKPVLLVTGLSATQIHLTWDKPSSLQLDPEDLDRRSELCGRIRQISGYILEVNGRVVTRLPPSKQSFTIKRCKPGMKYTCYLVAMTINGGKKERKDVTMTTIDPTDSEDEQTNSDFQARSDSLEVTIPRQDPPLVLNIHYSPTPAQQSSTSSSESEEPGDGCVVLLWKSSTPLKGVASYRVLWNATLEDSNGEESVNQHCSKYEIYPVKQRSLYTVWLKVTRKDGSKLTHGPLHCQVPGPSDPPWVWCKSISPYRLYLEWNEPRTYGFETIQGYHIQLNGRKIGKTMNKQTRKATVHVQPNSVYRIALMALNADPYLCEPVQSNFLNVSTPAVEQSGLNLKQNIRLKPLWAEKDSLTVEWSDDNDLLTVDHYVIKWSSVLQPQSKEKILCVEETSCCIEDCQPGTRHFIAIAAIDDRGKLVSKSSQLIMQTSAVLQAPNIQLCSALPSSIILRWEKPETIGDATVDAYEIKVNGEIVAMLDSSDLSFEWTKCFPCEEYSFMIKTVSSKDDCHSNWSAALLVTCPGASQPIISRAPSNQVNCIYVTWDPPTLYGDAKVDNYMVHYLPNDVELPPDSILGNPDVITHGPFPSTANHDTLTNASPSLPYWVVLEVSLLPLGCHKVLSHPIKTRVAAPPHPPEVEVSVLGLHERKMLERFASRLAHLKDRISCKVHKLQNTVVVKGSKQKETQIAKNKATLLNLDIELMNCIQYINNHTGTLNAELNWDRPRDDGDAIITGYQVFINDQKYKQPLDVNNFSINLKLPASHLDHVVTVKSLSNHPIGHSAPSREVNLLTKDFLPFVQYCYFGVHSESSDCCYEDTLKFEINKKLISTHRGSLGKPLPSPVCKVFNVFESSSRCLIDPSSKPQAVLFWTIWCQSSWKAMEMFIKFSQNHSEIDFITCCVHSDKTVSGHQQKISALLKSRDWISNNVHHVCGCNSLGQPCLIPKPSEGRGTNNNICHLYGIEGVPTILLCDQQGYMTWKGRIYAHNFAGYEKCLLHAINESLQRECSLQDCDQCLLDYELDTTGLTSHSSSDTHDYYDYKNAKQDSSLVVTGHLSRAKDNSLPQVSGKKFSPSQNRQIFDSYRSKAGLQRSSTIEYDNDVLRRRLHDYRPRTTPSVDNSNNQSITVRRAKTANHKRSSIFKDRFSSSMTSYLPSVGLTNEKTESDQKVIVNGDERLEPLANQSKEFSANQRSKKVKISVNHFSPV